MFFGRRIFSVFVPKYPEAEFLGHRVDRCIYNFMRNYHSEFMFYILITILENSGCVTFSLIFDVALMCYLNVLKCKTKRNQIEDC